MSLRDHEGYLIMDHRDSPGIPDAVVVASGMPKGAGHGVFEAATFTCRHCQSVVVINRNNDDHEVCRGCMHKICYGCGAVRKMDGRCRDFQRMIDEILNAAAKAA